jgi:hypothetical protein
MQIKLEKDKEEEKAIFRKEGKKNILQMRKYINE